MQVKLDEIIRAIGNAKNELLDNWRSAQPSNDTSVAVSAERVR